MYLTAHRVYSPSKKKTGINAFLYRHGGKPVPGMSWEHPVVELVAEQHVGTRGPEHVEIAPGANRVVSFVDVVAADDTPMDQIEAAIRATGGRLSPGQLPLSTIVGAVAVRFGAQFGLAEAQLREEFEQIAAQALELLKNPTEPAWNTREPLDVDVEQNEEGLRFSLRPDAKRRLAALHDAGWHAPRVSISHDTRDAFEAVHGDVLRNFVPILAELDAERVADMGGMRFYNARTGQLLLEWPQR